MEPSRAWGLARVDRESPQVKEGSLHTPRSWLALPLRPILDLGVRSATIVAMTTESLRAVRDHLSEVVDRVESQHERVVITRNGRSAAVLISPEDLAQLEETIDVLSDPQALADIREADQAYARGDVVCGVDAVRNLRR